MILSHKIKLNPTPEQVTYFRRACGVARFAFNWGLEHWQKEYEAGGKPSASSLYKQLNAIKQERYPWMYDVTKCALDGAFKNLDRAFKNFFERRNDAVGYPKFKSKHKSRQSFYIGNSEFVVDGHEVRIPKLGWVNMTEPLRFDGHIMSATVSTDGLDWYISITVEMEIDQQVEPGSAAGVDLGVKDMAVTSDGDVYENGHFQKCELRKLKRLQRELARRQKDSNGWLRTKAKLQKLHRKIKRRREWHIHNMTTELTKEYSVIAVEDLNVDGLKRNRHLSRAISDVGMYEIVRQLEYKAQLYGAVVVKVDRFYPSSKTCHDCGSKNDGLTLSDRTWICEDCGVVHDRDENAAKNIRDEGLRLLADSPVVSTSGFVGPGARVRPTVSGGVR